MCRRPGRSPQVLELREHRQCCGRPQRAVDIGVHDLHDLVRGRGTSSKRLAHREQRLEQVLAALAAGATTAREVVEVVYADVDRALWPAATMSVLAQLEYLR